MLRVLLYIVLFVVVSNIPNFFVNVKAKLSTYENGDMWKTFSCEGANYYYREPNPKSHDSAHAFFPYSLFSARALSKKNGGSFPTSPVLIFKMYRCASRIVRHRVVLRIVLLVQYRRACHFRVLPQCLGRMRRVQRLGLLGS